MSELNAAFTEALVARTARYIVTITLWMAFSAPVVSGGEPDATVAWFHEMRIGILAHDVDNLWSGTSVESGFDFNAEIIFARPTLAILKGDIRPNLGASINSQGYTSKLYGGFLWEIEGRTGIFFDTGLGLAVHNGELRTDKDDRKQLGSRVLFRVPIEFGYSFNDHHRIVITFDHVSNAYLASPNEGMDTLGLRYSYRF